MESHIIILDFVDEIDMKRGEDKKEKIGDGIGY